MFGIRDLRRRVKALEDKAAKAEQIANCATGKHKWEVCEHDGRSDGHVRCKHCYFHPEKVIKEIVLNQPFTGCDDLPLEDKLALKGELDGIKERLSEQPVQTWAPHWGDPCTCGPSMKCQNCKKRETAKSPQPVQCALEIAAEILNNFKGEGNKLEEWQACYAKLFTQMNELVQLSTKRESGIDEFRKVFNDAAAISSSTLDNGSINDGWCAVIEFLKPYLVPEQNTHIEDGKPL